MVWGEKQIRSFLLFNGLKDKEYQYALHFFNAKKVFFPQGTFLKHAGEKLDFFGLILSGTVQVAINDIDGEHLIMAQVQTGETFGESLCLLGRESDAEIRSVADTILLRMDTHSLSGPFAEEAGMLSMPNSTREANRRLEQELKYRFSTMLAARTLRMKRRIQILSQRSIREKLIVFFSYQPQQDGVIQVGMNREDMADYLGTNRSALSRELSRMQKDGLIRYNGNTFTILNRGSSRNKTDD